MSKILVVYYSRTGYTRTIAGRVARACGADLDQIEDYKTRAGAWGYMRSAVGAVMHLDAPILRPRNEPGGYDLILIGTPVWCRNVPGPVRTYIKENRQAFRRVAFFCTYGGSGQSKVLRDLEILAGRPALATFAITDSEVASKLYNRRLSKFVAKLQNTSKFIGQPSHGEPLFDDNLIGL